MTKCRVLSIVLCVSLLLTSCSTEWIQGSDKSDNEVESMEKEPILSYKIPSGQPHILVNQIGYEKEGIKTVIFVGEELPESFSVMDAETLEVVYTGPLVDKGNSDDNALYYGYGDFSDLTKEGDYFIQCDIWGRSYSFQIEENIYKILLEKSLSFFEENQLTKKINVIISDKNGEEKILQGGWFTDNLMNQELKVSAKAFMSLVLAWELYPHALKGEETQLTKPLIIEIMKRQVDWMLQLQEETTGGVYGGVLANEKKDGMMEYQLMDMSPESTAIFAATLAAFSYLYQNYDKEYADKCLKAADKAWKYMVQEKATLSPEGLFAAAELYRASGQFQYHNAVKTYFQQNSTINIHSEWELFGGITYLATKMAVDTQLCSSFMKEIMDKAESISSDSRKEFYLTEKNNEFNNTDEMLWNMVILGVADYVITNHEYATVIENYNHFLMGRNEKAMCLLNVQGSDKLAEEDKLIDNNLLYNAYYLFMLSQIMKDE